VKLQSKQINGDLYVDIEFDESVGIIYLMLNRVSFAITLEEFAELTGNINDAFSELMSHPNIMLGTEEDEETQGEIKTFVHMGEPDNEFIN